jgi:hypothetical protein
MHSTTDTAPVIPITTVVAPPAATITEAATVCLQKTAVVAFKPYYC